MSDNSPLAAQISVWLGTLTPRPEVTWLLHVSVGRVLVKTRTEDYKQHTHTVERIRDWLAQAVDAKADWLNRLDHLGRPKKLLKFSTIDGIVKEVMKAHAIEEQHLSRIVLNEEDEAFFADLGDGFHLVRLTSSKGLQRESGILHNCLSDQKYRDNVETGKFCYYVLRDAHSKSHLVMEVGASDSLVWEIRGKQNRPPKLKYLLPVVRFLTDREWPIRNDWSSGLLIDSVGRVHFTSNLPDVIDLRGNLTIFGCDEVALPPTLAVSGQMRLKKSRIVKPAEQLTATKIFIEDAAGPSLARSISVKHQFEMNNSAVFIQIADSLEVGTSFCMQENQHVIEMPDRLHVGNWMDVCGTSFKKFGKHTQVLGCLISREAAVEYSHTLDSKRNVIQADDLVQVTGDLIGPSQCGYANLRGRCGCVVRTYGSDGCLVSFENGEGGFVELATIGSDLIRLPDRPTPAPQDFVEVDMTIDPDFWITDLPEL